MQNLDPNTLFSIFEQGDEAIYREYSMDEQLDNPYVLINMVVKGLENYKIMDQMYMQRYPKQYKGTRKVIQYKYFNKLYSHLSRVNFDNIRKDALVGDSYEIMHNTYFIEGLMFYFERIEQYEKCATIKKYLNILESSRIPQLEH